ncbi:MAG: glycosyltransferase family 2 protein [Candidatus Daviesbacteria bacterium]|nr:glycosyltransferase family 2 protein [Candidatus Daviesbacteria bacterium]
MRILLIFGLSVIMAFYLTEFIRRFLRISLHQKSLHFPHSFIGFVLMVSGILVGLLGQPLVNPPNDTLLAIALIGSGFGVIIHHLFANSFIFSERLEQSFMKEHETLVERLLEILPGALTWLALTSPIWLSFTLPFAVAYLILLADIYWLFSAIRISVLIYIGYNRMQKAKKQDWQRRLETDFPGDWNKYSHLILLPTYKEGLAIIEPTFNAIAASTSPHQKIFLSVGFEEWDDPDRVATIKEFLDKNAHKIGGVFISTHKLQTGEVKGPGTNRNWMVNSAVTKLKEKNINLKDVLVTTIDADFVLHPQFLPGMLHKYLSTPLAERNKRSFTGVFLYNNNYWQAPTPMRVIATGTAFWQISEMVGSDKYINFASLSINMQTLLDMGLWLPNKVNDDAGFYWKSYYFFNGDYKVIPHYLPISADTVQDVSLLKTFQNQYLQLKRWAYGVEHIPFIFKQFFTKKDMDFWDKTDKLTFIVWSYFKWGTLALFITFGGLFIPLINPGYAQSVVYYNLSVVSSWILTAAFIGLFSTIYFNEKIAPPRPANWSRLKRIWSYVQWILVPIILISITTLPAIDAQTSLMLKRYLEFRVTNKARVSPS